MGCKLCKTKKGINITSLNINYTIQDDIDFTSIPIDEFLCPKCGCISIILSNSISNNEIAYYCRNEGVVHIEVEEFFIETKVSEFQYLKQKCEECKKSYIELNNDKIKDKKDINKIIDYINSNIFKYCYICKKIFCNKCYENQGHKCNKIKGNNGKFIKINEAKGKCPIHFGERYKYFCLDCQEHICKDEFGLHSGHELQDLSDLRDKFEKNFRNIILEKNKQILNIIKFNNNILSENNNNYYKSITNMKESITKDNDKSEYIDLLINKYDKDNKIQNTALKNVNKNFSRKLNGKEKILN